MNLTIDAVFENGVLRPLSPLPLVEKQQVRVIIATQESDPVSRTRGLLGWNGDAETVEFFALDPQLDPSEWP